MKVDLDIDENEWLVYKNFDGWLLSFEKLFRDALGPKMDNDIDYTLNVLLTDDGHIRKINKKYRNVNTPTNVLSFPLFSKEELLSREITNGLIGDVILSYNSINNEAISFRKTFCDRAFHLFVHGVLHILGFDHDSEESRSIMEDLEIQILKKNNIEDPYLYL